jgi:putative transposase
MDKPLSEYWLTVEEVAGLIGLAERTVRHNAIHKKYGEPKYEDSLNGGGKNGQILKINLQSLPVQAQVAYLRETGHMQEAAVLDDGWEQEPKWRRDIAAERLQIITAWGRYIASRPDRRRTELTGEFLQTWTIINPENKNCSDKTLYRWRKDYRDGGRMALIPNWGSSKRDEIIDPKAWAYFDEIYGTLQKRTAADCYRELKTVAALRGWRLPSLRTVQRKINQYPKAYWVLRREGKKEFEEKCLPYMQRDKEALRGGEVWVGDGHTLDFFVKGPNGKPVRPVLSAWVDMRSAKWLGWQIDYTNDTDIVMAAFARAALDPEIGIPYQLYLDNGREYDNIQFAYGGHRRKTKDAEKYDEARIHSLVYQLGIETIFAIPANGRAKIIERQFGEVARRFSKRFATYCGSDNKERPEGLNDILKNPDNLPDLQTVRELFDKWVVTERNQQPSQGQGRKGETPDQTFFRTRLPVRLVPETVLQLCFMPHPRPQVVTRQGVNIFDTDYYNDKLIEHLGEKVIVRYRNEDLTKVYIFTQDEQYICDALMDDLVHPTKATKEDFEKYKSTCKKATKNIEQIKDGLVDHGGIMTFPEYLDEKSRQIPPALPVEKTNVVAMAPISNELLNSAKAVQKLVVGGDNIPTYEERKAAERERIRETMRAVNKSMAMKK